jgi:hypothetical protein
LGEQPLSRIGSIILSFFAAIWGIIGLYNFHAPVWAQLAPVLVTAAITLMVWRARPGKVRSKAEERRIGRLLTRASAAEGIGILVVVNVVTWVGRPDLAAASVAAVVGLHFLPLARGLPATRYYITAAAMLLTALVGMLFSRPEMTAIRLRKLRSYFMGNGSELRVRSEANGARPVMTAFETPLGTDEKAGNSTDGRQGPE